MSAVTIAVCNFKGGVAKTTTAVHLAYHAAVTEGLRTLLVDMDSQGQSGRHLGIDAGDHPGMYEVLVRDQQHSRDPSTSYIPLARIIQRDARPGLDIITNDATLGDAEQAIAQRLGREKVLMRRLTEVSSEYDRIIIDAHPTYNLTNILALFAANAVLVPLDPGAAAIQGYDDLTARLDDMRFGLGYAPRVIGVLATRVDHRTSAAARLLEYITANFDPPQRAGVIRARTQMVEAYAHGRTIFEHAPDSDGASDYRAAATWLTNAIAQGTGVQHDHHA